MTIASIVFNLLVLQGPCGGCPGIPCAPCCPDCFGPPPPPGLPVDNLIIVVLFLGIIYGSWQIWKLTKKTV